MILTSMVATRVVMLASPMVDLKDLRWDVAPDVKMVVLKASRKAATTVVSLVALSECLWVHWWRQIQRK